MLENRMDIAEQPHRRQNLLTGEWVLVSPHRNKRPWQGKVDAAGENKSVKYDPDCYLCPGNKRADGTVNPSYTGTHVFTNDYAAMMPETISAKKNEYDILIAETVAGKCRVICFSPEHHLTLPQLSVEHLTGVIDTWCEEYKALSADPEIKYVQIFENKGAIMGCSNPHPHGQIWASDHVPEEVRKEEENQRRYFIAHGRSLLQDYLQLEMEKQERIVIENQHFVALVPFWAVWPYETMIVSRRQVQSVTEFNSIEREALALLLKQLTTRYDNLFNTSFPYSAGMHQAPVNSGSKPYWHWHMHFYPPLLRSATVKKFMVGYELLAGPQRDITPETAAQQLSALSDIHYLQENKA